MSKYWTKINFDLADKRLPRNKIYLRRHRWISAWKQLFLYSVKLNGRIDCLSLLHILKLLWKGAEWIIMFDAWSGWIWQAIFIASLLVGLMLVIAHSSITDCVVHEHKSKHISFLNSGSLLCRGIFPLDRENLKTPPHNRIPAACY